MNAAIAENSIKDVQLSQIAIPSACIGNDPTALAGIYQEHANIAIWQRSFTTELSQSIEEFVAEHPVFSKALTLSPESAFAKLNDATHGQAPKAMLEDMAELVDMFCCLFDLEAAGLRLATLSDAMCPRFHVDKVPCRLVTTYQGVATEWLPNHVLDRSKLGHGSNGLPDSASGLYHHKSAVQQLSCGDVALLKGGSWEGNEHTALVHRSPVLNSDAPRLLMTLDFA